MFLLNISLLLFALSLALSSFAWTNIKACDLISMFPILSFSVLSTLLLPEVNSLKCKSAIFLHKKQLLGAQVKSELSCVAHRPSP